MHYNIQLKGRKLLLAAGIISSVFGGLCLVCALFMLALKQHFAGYAGDDGSIYVLAHLPQELLYGVLAAGIVYLVIGVVCVRKRNDILYSKGIVICGLILFALAIVSLVLSGPSATLGGVVALFVLPVLLIWGGYLNTKKPEIR